MKVIEDVSVVRQENWTATSLLQGGSVWFYGVGYVCPPPAYSESRSSLMALTTSYRYRVGDVQPKQDGAYRKTLPYNVVEGQNALVMLNDSQTWTEAGEHPPLVCGPSNMTWSEPILISGAPPAHIHARVVDLQDKIRARLVDKIASAGPNLPVIIGEARDTYDMVVDTGRKLGLVMRAIARGDFLGAARHLGYTKLPPKLNRLQKHRRRDGKELSLDDLANNWLAFRYGWNPLIQDIYAILKQIEKDFGSERTVLLHSQSRLSIDIVTPHSGGNGNGTIGQYLFSCGHSQDGNNDTRVTCHAWASYTETSTAMRMLHDWGILNPALVVWELVPLSFVADWLVSVGAYLQSLEYSTGLTLSDAGIGTTITNVKTGVVTSNWTRKEYNFHANYMSYERRAYDSFSAIPPPLKVGTSPGNWKRLLDAVALLRAFSK